MKLQQSRRLHKRGFHVALIRDTICLLYTHSWCCSRAVGHCLAFIRAADKNRCARAYCTCTLLSFILTSSASAHLVSSLVQFILYARVAYNFIPIRKTIEMTRMSTHDRMTTSSILPNFQWSFCRLIRLIIFLALSMKQVFADAKFHNRTLK